MALRKSKKALKSRLAELGKKPRQILLPAIILLLLVPAGLSQLKAAFLAQLAMNNGAELAHFSKSLTDPDALAGLARKEHLANGNLPKALALYKQSLAHFVLHVPSWLGIAELFNDLGQKEKAAATLRAVHAFAANTEDTAWTKALLADELDQEDVLAESLSWLADHAPGKREEIFALADLRWQDTTALMHRFRSTQYANLLAHYMRINEPAKAGAVWLGLEQAGLLNPDITLQYINFLLQQDTIDQAAILWRRHYQKDGALLYDGAFREPFINSGFAWRISRSKGADWQQLPGPGGLTLTFAGTDNVSFSLSQIVPLAPGQYLFKGRQKTQGLTTDQRPFWSISGYKCEGLAAAKEAMAPETMPLQEFVLPFSVPDTCQAVQLTLQRNTSYFFDNKLAGTITLEGLRIEPLAGAGSRQAPVKVTEKSATKLGETTDIRINKMNVH